MIAVIFEVWPAQGREDDYLAIAAALRADLDIIDGFISVERFQSRSGKAVVAFVLARSPKPSSNGETISNTARVQTKGRTGVFVDYPLRGQPVDA